MRTVIIKVTHNCNLGCKYCCVGDVPNHRPMSFDTIRNLFAKLAEDGPSSSLIWHGGEPLSVGLDFYKYVVDLQNEYPNHHFKNGIQTNGTLLNEDFLQFCKTYEFQLGFSIDGCRESHNSNRPYKSGKASFDDTFKWFLRAKEIGLNVGAICVINANTAQYIDEIYEFSKYYKVPFKFNPQYPAGRATINVDLGLDNDKIAEVYIRLFDLWYKDDPKSRANIQMFDRFVDAIGRCTNGDETLKGYDCAYCNRCQYSFVGLAPNGDIYPCGKFVGEEEFCCGNINDKDFSFTGLLKNPIVQSIIRRHEEGVAACKDCQFLSLCSSGCPYNAKLFSGDIMAKNPFCRANILIFEHIKRALLKNNIAKDIYVIPEKESDHKSFLIYSPLRGKVFTADETAAEAVKRYLLNGEIDDNNRELANYLYEWENQIAVPLRKGSTFNKNGCTILLTQSCNFLCSYCYAIGSHGNRNLNKSQLKSVVDYILGEKNDSQLKSFSFIGGGEPTMDWEKLKWCIDYIRANDISHSSRISLTTNCSLLNYERIAWLKEMDVNIVASFDILPDIQNSQRCFASLQPSFDVVHSNILELLNKKVNVRIRSTITKDIVKRMPEMINFVLENYPEIHYIQMEPVMDISQNDDDFFNEFIEKFMESKEIGDSHGVEIFNTLSLSANTIQAAFCRGEICVCPTGDISLCHRISSEEDTSWSNYYFGNIDEGGVHIDNDKLKQVMAYHVRRIDKCSSCFAKYHCAGGCSAVHSKLSEAQYEAYCQYSKNLIKSILLYYIYKY